jgi:hypothetical protein
MLSASLLFASTALAGLVSGPGDAYQLRFDEGWYTVGEHELAPVSDPETTAVELLEVFEVGEGSLSMALREQLRQGKPGTETSAEGFVALGGREGAVIHTTRMRKLSLQQLSWAAIPLGDGTAALVALRFDGSAQSTDRSAFLELAGSAALPGVLADLPYAQLEERWRLQQAPPDELVELRGLFFEGGALRGELFNGSERTLNRAVLDVQVRDAEGRHQASRKVEVVPGPERRALGAGQSLPFHIDLSEGGAAPAGLGGARVESLEWAPAGP